MHILLTDRLICPRCGPEWPLILLAHEVRDRRILEGDLGCPSCDTKFPVRKGFGDLRIPPFEDPPSPSHASDPPADQATEADEEAVKLAALMGLTTGPGMELILGQRARLASALAGLLEEVEIVAADPRQVSVAERPGVSRMAVGPAMPFRSHSFQAVALADAPTPEEVREGARVTAPMGRVVAFRVSEAGRDLLEGAGFRILLWQDGTLVGERERL
jgi:hypothetical protein